MARMADDDLPDTARELAPPHSGVVLQFPSGSATLATGGEQLLNALHARLSAQLCEYASHYLSADDADDVVQQAFIELWRRYVAESRTPTASYEAVLYESVKFRILDFRRTRKRRGLAIIAGHYAAMLNETARRWMRPDADVERESFSKVVNAAVQHMTPRARELHVMHYNAGFTVHQIVDMTGVARSTVKTLLQRGNRVLREHLERAGYSPVVRRAARDLRENAS